MTKVDGVNDRFVRTLRGESVDRPPVWAMRQAGRWDPEFQRLRAGREFFEFANDPHAAAAASLCPQRFGVDAIILFYDITTLAVAMGQEFRLVPDLGPQPDHPIRGLADVERLTREPAERDFRAVLETLRLVRQETNDRLPSLVFAGAPYTLAVYQLGVGKNKSAVRQFAAEHPEAWHRLLDTTTDATIVFLRALLTAGAAAYQLFDSWAGALSPEEYAAWCAPYHQRIFTEVAGSSILFVKDGPLEAMAKSGAQVLSLSKQHSISHSNRLYPHLVFQGNVDHELLITGPPEEVHAATRRCLAEAAGARHILNLDHGMDRLAKVKNFVAFVDAVRSL